MIDPDGNEGKPIAGPSFIFTNARGNVVFTDDSFLAVSGQPAEIRVSGNSLQDLLTVDMGFAARMLETIKHDGAMEGFHLPIREIDGIVEEANCSGVAVVDENGNFIGADLVLGSVLQFQNHSDVIKSYVDRILNEGNRLESRTFIQSYIAAQFDALQILLARIVGPAARHAFEVIVNNTAVSNAIALSMHNGRIEFTQRNIDIQRYRSLLKTSVTYAVNVMGRKKAKREVLLVDRCIGSGTLDLITQMDLQIFMTD
jgi:hypothetical protein